MEALTNPTVIAAAIAAVSAIAGALLADRIKRVVVRDAAAGHLMRGWDRYTGHLMQRVSDLEDEMRRKEEDCERRIDKLDAEMDRRDHECKTRIADLERRLSGGGL